MEDILYLNDKVYDSLKEFCSEELINVVLESFKKYGVIVRLNKLDVLPSKVWMINNFVKDEDCNPLHKWFVISTFCHIGGIIKTNESNFIEDSGLISFCA